MMRYTLISLVAVGLAACNSPPEPTVSTGIVAPASFDTAIHDDLSCGQLAEERLWVSSVLYKEETAKVVGTERAASVLAYDEASLDLTDKDVAQLKGYLLAIDTSMLKKRCQTG